MANLKLMKRVRIYILTLILLICTTPMVKGQAAILALIFGDKIASEKFNLSLEIGGGNNMYSGLIDDTRAPINTFFGLGLNFKMTEHIYFTPAVYFVAKNQAQLNALNLESGNPNLDAQFVGVKTHIQTNYTDLPLLFSYQTNSEKWRFGLGAQLSFRGKVNATFENNEGEFIQDYKSYTESFNWGPIAEIDYILPKIRKGKGLILRLRYFHGMNNVFNQNFAGGTEVKFRGLQFMLGLPFLTDELAQQKLDRLNK